MPRAFSSRSDRIAKCKSKGLLQTLSRPASWCSSVEKELQECNACMEARSRKGKALP
ncbi:hypothetical protein [Helicobacter burdigaliensis]|uniref:hypothetical protein n=1 Tax=Helicobacter burdigaliensis TaxID=2315334 RepID=UPI0018E5195E|nr:hypothetical protein [Helicobacter burdigaliensis]